MNQHVTILAQRFWPDAHGGVETHMRQMAIHLARAGCCVEVRTENRGAAPTLEQVEPNYTVRRDTRVDPGILWRWMPLVTVNAWRKQLAADPPQGLIWASNPMLAVAALTAGLAEQIVYNPAGCVAAMRSIGKLYPHVNTMQAPRTVEWLDRYAWRHCPRVVVSSDNVRALFHRHYGLRDNVHVMPLAASKPDTTITRTNARLALNIRPDAFVVGFVGRLDPCKGIDHLLDAFAHAGLRPRSRLLLVGDGPDRPRLERRIDQLGLARHVVWAGRMADPSLSYEAMNVLVLPSVYEAYGLVMVEAMAAGVPVLGRAGNGRTILTASDEIIEHQRTGFVFDSHDPVDLARKLRILESDPILRRTMGEAGRRAAENRTWPAYARHVIQTLFEPESTLQEILHHAA